VYARNLAPDSDNKIHDDAVARQFGFTGALVPGVDVMAYASHPFAAAWGAEFLSGGRLFARFRKPVYDGELITVSCRDGSEGATELTLAGDDGEGRCVGSAWPAHGATVDVSRFGSVPLPDRRVPAEPGAIALGPLGSIDQPVDHERHSAYLAGIAEELPVYEKVAHPGALLRLVNELLVRNVELGPWIHTSSDCRFLALAQLPGTLHADGIVTELSERNGHHYVRYDALVSCDGIPVALVDHTAIYRLAGD
jgi:acyl dehydratase